MTTTLDIDTLAIHHGGEEIAYRLRVGGYLLEGNSITFSVDCEAVEEGQFPSCALICLENQPLYHPPQVGDVYKCQGGMLVNDENVPQRAWGYFTFHVDQITQVWTIESVEGDVLVVSLEAKHDDVKYYGDQARETTSRGRFSLSPRPKSELWIPS